MKTRLFRAGRNAALLSAVSAPAFALGPGRLAATAAINGLSGEVSGPLAYGLSLIAIVGTAVSWSGIITTWERSHREAWERCLWVELPWERAP